MIKMIVGLAVGFGIGVGSRWLGIPSPAPQAITGAFLVLSMTVGYLAMGAWMDRRRAGTGRGEG